MIKITKNIYYDIGISKFKNISYLFHVKNPINIKRDEVTQLQ